MEDINIIDLYFKRDENAIIHTQQKYKKLCFGIAHNVLGNMQESEECVNDTLLGVWNAIPPSRPNNLKAFICRIARNTALMRLKYNKAQKRSPDFAVSLSELEEIIPDERLNPEYSNEDIGRLISVFLNTLKPEVRNVFLRKYWFFDSVNDIMLRYGFSESKVKNILYHTRNKLRDYLKEEGIEL